MVAADGDVVRISAGVAWVGVGVLGIVGWCVVQCSRRCMGDG
jgi:hypothetical protein